MNATRRRRTKHPVCVRRWHCFAHTRTHTTQTRAGLRLLVTLDQCVSMFGACIELGTPLLQAHAQNYQTIRRQSRTEHKEIKGSLQGD
jgi:hypothetical protein